jgi:hypothetical protein
MEVYGIYNTYFNEEKKYQNYIKSLETVKVVPK